MPLVRVGEQSALPPGSVTEVVHADASYAVCNIDGQIRCTEGICPHAGGPLGQGNVSGNAVVCPWHGWEFDTATGANDFDPDLVLKTFPVVLEGGTILIDVP